MIAGFKCKDTERLWLVGTAQAFPPDIQRTAVRKLLMLDAAPDVRTLAAAESPGRRQLAELMLKAGRAANVRQAFTRYLSAPLAEPATVTWHQEATAYAVMKWPSLAAHSRASVAEALATVTPALTRPATTDPTRPLSATPSANGRWRRCRPAARAGRSSRCPR